MIVERDPEGREIEALARHLRLEGKRVLEIGSGNGRLTWRLASLASHVAGFDVEHESVLEALQSRPAEFGRTVDFYVADAEHVPHPAGLFDLVIFAWSF